MKRMLADPIDIVVRQIIAEAVPWHFANVRVDIPDGFEEYSTFDGKAFEHLFTWHLARQPTRRQAEERAKLKAITDEFMAALDRTTRLEAEWMFSEVTPDMVGKR